MHVILIACVRLGVWANAVYTGTSGRNASQFWGIGEGVGGVQ